MVHLLPGHSEHRQGRSGRAPDADALPPGRREGPGEEEPAVTAGVRPDLITLSDAQRERVRGILRDRSWRCSGCGRATAEIGQALYLGFLFRSEDLDAYMIGLTCATPGCSNPRDGIRLHEDEFAPEGAGTGGTA